MEKECIKCNVIKQESDYRDGRNQCKNCETKMRRERRERQRKEDPEFDKQYRQSEVKRKRRQEKENKLIGFKDRLRKNIRSAFRKRGYTKKSSTYMILGESYENVKLHFESKFVEGMSWDNMSEWDIDHIIPLSSVNTEEEYLRLCHYTNLQPLWREDNKKKGSKIL